MLRRGGVYRKWTHDAAREAATTAWLRSAGLPAAEVLDVGDGWFETREIAGRSAAEPWPVDRRRDVVDSLAEFSTAMHTLPVGDCPFDRSLAVTVPAARAAVLEGRVDVDRLDGGHAGRSAAQLLAALDAPGPAGREDLVVTHGDFCLPNVILDDDARVVGIVDTGRAGLADRYTDLALMSRSLRRTGLNPQYGARYAERYLLRCGHRTDDDDRLAFYCLLDDLA